MVNYLTPGKRRYYEDRRDDLKNLIKGEDKNIPSEYADMLYTDVKVRTIDSQSKESFLREIKKIEHVLEFQIAPTVNDVEENKVYSRYKELKKEITECMLTEDEHQKATDYNIEKQLRWQKTMVNSGKVDEFRNCCRILDKDDELIGKLDEIRR